MFFSLLLLILGATFGSFISAFSYRYPRKISILKGRSFCPNCKKTIGWYDNIPVVSFLLLRRRCRNCKKPISWRYPAIELITALGFLAVGWNPYLLIELVVLELIFVIDLEHQIIPDDFIFFGIYATSLYAIFYIPSTFFPSLFAGFASAALLLTIHLATRGRGMGLGDVKFAILGGMIAGPNLFLIWLFVSFLTGGVAGIILILAGRARLKDKIAFGPFLVIGLALTLIWGEKFLGALL